MEMTINQSKALVKRRLATVRWMLWLGGVLPIPVSEYTEYDWQRKS